MIRSAPAPRQSPDPLGTIGRAVKGGLTWLVQVITLNDNGRAVITNLVSGLGGTVPKYIGWGTGAGAAAHGNSSLSTEKLVDLSTSAGTDHTTGTPTRTTTSTTNDTYTVTGTRAATGSGTVTNAGLFDAASGGNLFMSGDSLSIALVSGDSIAFTFNMSFS